MTMNIDNLRDQARALGACELLEQGRDYQSLARLMFSPAGLEFCAAHDFPRIDFLRRKRRLLEAHAIYVDRPGLELCNRDVCLAGSTSARLTFTGGTCVYKVVLMHGASVRIEASDYAVVRLYNISGGTVKIVNDKTAIIL